MPGTPDLSWLWSPDALQRALAGAQQQPAHRQPNAAAARRACDEAAHLWGLSEGDEQARAELGAACGALWLTAARSALLALTPDGDLKPWADAAGFTAKAPPAVARLIAADGAARIVAGNASELPVGVLRRHAEALLELAEAPFREVQSARRLALLRVGVIAVVAMAVLGAGVTLLLRLTAPPDLALGRPWKASSKLADCHPDQGECAGAKITVFFHTTEEENPWLEYDLEAPKTVSSATIENRRDEARERAVPLAVELSDDEKNWREVARKDEVFDTWRPHWASQTARYVRLRVLKRSSFHLQSVQLHP